MGAEEGTTYLVRAVVPNYLISVFGLGVIIMGVSFWQMFAG